MAYRFAEFELDPDLYQLRRDGERVPLERRIVDLLRHLIEARERVVPRVELMETIWPSVTVDQHSLDQALYTLRRALGDDPRRPRFVATVRGRGIRFVAEAECFQPRPAALGPGGVPPFVGRVELMSELEAALADAAAGRGGIVTLAGEAGIGKTRLAEEFAERARERGAAVRMGRAREHSGAPAFWPWIELLAEDVGRLSIAEREELAAASPELAVALLGSEGPPPTASPLDGEAARFRLFRTVQALLERRIAESGAVVLVLDDFHCFDELSARLALFLASEIAEARILLVVLHRDVALYGTPEIQRLHAGLVRLPACLVRTVSGLSADEAAELTRAFELDAPREFSRELHELTGGNPFFIVNVLRAAPDPEGGGVSARLLPVSLRDSIEQHVRDLGAEQRSLLEVASVLGKAVDLEHLAGLLERPVLEIRERVRAAERAGLLVSRADASRASFAHILVRDVLYEAIAPARRAELHARAYRVLEGSGSSAWETAFAKAHHARAAADLLGRELVVRLAVDAAAAAARALAFREAAELCRSVQGLARELPAAQRCDLLLTQGSAEIRSGQRAEGRESLLRAAGLAESSGDFVRAAEAALGLSPGFFSLEIGVVDRPMLNLLERTLDACPEGEPELRVRLAARLAMALRWTGESARRADLVARAEAAATSLGAETRALVACAKCVALWTPENLADRLEWARTTIDLADSTGASELALMGRVFHVSCLVEQGASAEAAMAIDELQRGVEDFRLPQAYWYADLYRGLRSLERGDIQDALARIAAMSRHRERYDDANMDQAVAAQFFTAAWWRLELDQHLAAIQGVVDRYPVAFVWRLGLVLAHIDAGNMAAARAEFGAVAANDFAGLPADLFRVYGLAISGHVAAILGDREATAVALHLLQPFRDHFAVGGYGVVTWGSVARTIGKLASFAREWDWANTSFEAAARIEGRAGALSWLIDTKLSHAASLVRQGRSRDRTRAEELWIEARELARQLRLPRALCAVERFSL